MKVTKQNKQPLRHLIVFLGLESESAQTKQTASLRVSKNFHDDSLMTITKLIMMMDSDNENKNDHDDGNNDDDNNNDNDDDDDDKTDLILSCIGLGDSYGDSDNDIRNYNDDIYIMMFVCLSRFCLFCLPPAKLLIYI